MKKGDVDGQGDPPEQWRLTFPSSKDHGAFPCSVVEIEFKRNEGIALVTEL